MRTAHKPPGEQDFRENESPHDINLNQIYGLGEEQTRMLRSKVGGRLKSQIIDGDEYPVFLFDQETAELKPEFEGLYTEVNFNRVYGAASREHKLHSFAVGLEHGNFVLGNTMFNILFLREHNRVAGIISNAHPKWNDERVFQTTRNVLIVLLLKIVVGDYVHHLSELPVFVDASGWAEEETWYRPNWASVEFTLLYRWHDLLPNNVTLGGETRSSAEVVQNNRWLLEVGTEQAFIDASSQKMGAMGLENTPDYLMHIRMLSLQMARTCKLPSFVSYLKEYGLVIPKSFEELTGEQDIAARLATVYDSVEDVEWFVGLFAQGSSPPFTFAGLLMAYMVANDAVTQLFTNPLLSKRVFNNDTFSSEGMGIIEDTERLHDLVIRNTRITDKTLVAFGFDRRD